MIKIITFLIFIINILLGSDLSSLRVELSNISYKQRTVLIDSFMIGSIHDLGYTMSAIAWQESKFGEIPINIQDPSFGVYHNNINSVMKRLSIYDNNYQRNIIASRLINDFEFASSMALAELLYWKNQYNGSWSKTVKSYNAGWNIKAGTRYYNEIKKKVKILKQYLDLKGNETQAWMKLKREEFLNRKI